MDSFNGAELEDIDDLPPPPPVPPNVVPVKAEDGDSTAITNFEDGNATSIVKASKPQRSIMARPGLARKGTKINLLTNHFKVSLGNMKDDFHHYSVSLKYEDGKPIDGKGIGRKVIDKLHQTYDTELGKKDFAYDGEKSLFTIGALPQVKNEFTVVLEEMGASRAGGNGNANGNDSPNEADRKRMKRNFRTKTYKVEINFAAKIPKQSIALALKGQDSENSQEALRVLDIILRQHAAKQGCLLVRQSFFFENTKNLSDIGGGVMGCPGFHSSFRTSQGGLSLNIDVSTTMIVKPGPVIQFLVQNQNVREASQIDWAKAKRALKNLRISTLPHNQEYKIVGLSEKPCNEQLFSLKQRNGSDEMIELTVYDYFLQYKNMELRDSAFFPCINVGKPKRPTYIPMELCRLVSLQRYTKALTTSQRSGLVEKSRQKPAERMQVLNDALKHSDYNSDPMLRSCGISISPNFTTVEGRVLQAPKLRVGNGEDFFPNRGRWNFNNKKLVEPAEISKWAIVNFSARCDIHSLVRDMLKCANMKGIKMEHPFGDFIQEHPSSRRAPPAVRVDNMFEELRKKLPGAPKFILCLLSERKNSDVYGPWKRKCLSEFGIVTQCIAPMKVNDQYLTNVLLKINAKMGGVNSYLTIEKNIPLVSNAPTMILGMDVSHGSPGQADIPSIAAVVSSRQWPLISKYRATVRTQSPKVEMIDSLFKPVSDKDDDGIIRELLIDFYVSSGKRKPDQIIIFRDGVSESQFNQVLNIELDQIIEACKFLDEAWNPKFTLIIAQKNHHTKFFQSNSQDNVPPGTVIDDKVCHPRNYDFYICPHFGAIGTTRPTHYHVLMDQIGFSPDDLQELVHSLSYVYQRSTTAISVVAPICYAHLAASQVGQFIKFDEMSDTSSSRGGGPTGGNVPVPELPRLHENVCTSMFFC